MLYLNCDNISTPVQNNKIECVTNQIVLTKTFKMDNYWYSVCLFTVKAINLNECFIKQIMNQFKCKFSYQHSMDVK